MFERDSFTWSAGIEDTFIAHPFAKTGRTLDEYELTGHYARWRQDFDLLASLGIRSTRYGIPWYRVNPAAGVWNWDWPDRTIDRLLELGIEPIVDLVHYGVPDWIEGSFASPDYPERVADYAHAVAERYRGRVRAYTPLNEPRVTAWYCGMIGSWPPYGRGRRSYVALTAAIARGIQKSVHAIHSAVPGAVIAHVDATDIYIASTPDLESEAEFRRRNVYLALDLVCGRVTTDHPHVPWLRRYGLSDEALADFAEDAVPIDLLGLNMYPMYSQKVLSGVPGRVRIRMPYATPKIVDTIVQGYWERYNCPLFISETAASGSPAKKIAWLNGSLDAVRRVRGSGVAVVGYTWWPVFSLVGWAYRQGSRAAAEYLVHMGLYDLDAVNGHERVPTGVDDVYRAIVADGSARVGQIGDPRCRGGAIEDV